MTEKSAKIWRADIVEVLSEVSGGGRRFAPSGALL